MPIHFTCDQTKCLVVYAVEENTTVEEMSEFLDAVLQHPDFQRGFDFLGDLRGVNTPPDSNEVHFVANAVKTRKRQLTPCRWAVVMADLVSYGMARMLGLLTESSGVEIHPFYTVEDAARWLELSSTDALFDSFAYAPSV